MISRAAFCSAQAARMLAARTGLPRPSRAGSAPVEAPASIQPSAETIRASSLSSSRLAAAKRDALSSIAMSDDGTT